MKMKVQSKTMPPIKKSRQLKFLLFLLIGILFLIIISILFIIFGAADIKLFDIKQAFKDFDNNNYSHITIRNIRVPRVLANIIVGSSLAVTGAIMQGSTHNPLADSGLMGISSGATLAVALSLAFFPATGSLKMMLYSCIGASVTTALTYLIASLGRRGMTPERLILAGMSISMLFGSLSTVVALKHKIGKSLTYWMAGGTASTNWTDIKIALPIFILGMIAAVLLSPSITVMSLGEDVATGLGIKMRFVKICNTILVLVLTGVSVIIVGPVGFVGLIVPHIVRHVVGVDYRHIIPATAVYGAVFVVLADLIGRIIMKPFELPIGIVFSVIGVPFFIFLSRRQRREFE